MKIGDTAETSAWLTGEETPEVLEFWKIRVTEAMDEICREFGYTHGPVTFTEMYPGDDRVPEVPDHISGPDVRLLYAEATIVSKVMVKRNSFLGDVDRKDLQRLRAVTQRSYRKHFPKRPPLTEEQCDAIIEEMGPRAAYEAVRATTDQDKLN